MGRCSTSKGRHRQAVALVDDAGLDVASLELASLEGDADAVAELDVPVVHRPEVRHHRLGAGRVPGCAAARGRPKSQPESQTSAIPMVWS